MAGPFIFLVGALQAERSLTWYGLGIGGICTLLGFLGVWVDTNKGTKVTAAQFTLGVLWVILAWECMSQVGRGGGASLCTGCVHAWHACRSRWHSPSSCVRELATRGALRRGLAPSTADARGDTCCLPRPAGVLAGPDLHPLPSP